ncbi:interferon-induced, double-stranded RNA-activated protein kinase [Diretmus argenteus]
METNYVAKLNEFAQRTRAEVKYEDVAVDGPDHIKTFTQRAVINGQAYSNGVGKNKKEAKQNAAKHALSGLLKEKEDPGYSDAPSTENPPSMVVSQPGPICWLNEYGHKNRIGVKAVESTCMGPSSAPLCCYFVVGNKAYPEAFGRTKKEAKEKAAKLVFDEIGDSKTNGTSTSDESCSTSSQQKEEFNQNILEVCDKKEPSKNLNEYSFETTNYIGLINHYCQKTNRYPDFKHVKTCGPPHNPEFFYKLVISDKEYPEGRGKSAKDAKQNAAQLAWSDLQEQTDFNSQVSYRSSVSEEGAPSDFSTPPSIRFTSDYDSIEHLGKGGFGRVYKARQKLVDTHFAVKIVRCKKKSLREVGALQYLLNPNIVRYYTCWTEDSDYKCDTATDSYSTSQSSSNSSGLYLYIQMELCDKKTLKVWIDERNSHPRDIRRREESLPIAQQIVSGVEYIHSMKLIHRDLKPPNIMFGMDRNVKIGDFGLVTPEDNDDDESLMERTKRTGTRSYMAPEQCNQTTYDRKVDIFALGLIYFELLCLLSTSQEKAATEKIRDRVERLQSPRSDGTPRSDGPSGRLGATGRPFASERRVVHSPRSDGASSRLGATGRPVASERRVVQSHRSDGSSSRIGATGRPVASERRVVQSHQSDGSSSRLRATGRPVASERRVVQSPQSYGSSSRLGATGHPVASERRVVQSPQSDGSSSRLRATGRPVASERRVVQSPRSDGSSSRL